MSFPVAEAAGEREAVYLNESVFRAGRQGVEDAVTRSPRCSSTPTS